jgi:ATPase related to the helicase subunit of the Holliday junction resolvase
MLSEKYRPKTLDEIVGQEEIVAALKEFIRRKDFPHLMFVGPPGLGKTSTAYAFAHDAGIPIIEFNASDDRTLEFIRERIKPIAMNVEEKIILLDEFDAMTQNAQFALRRIMEETKSTHFILTGNNESNIIDAIKSRCSLFRFKPIPKDELTRMIVRVLKEENVKFKSKEEVQQVINGIVELSEGDLRRTMNLLEQSIIGGNISLNYLKLLVSPNLMNSVLQLAMKGDLNEALKQLEDVYTNLGLDYNLAFRKIYQGISKLDMRYRAVCLMELARAEQAVKEGANPLIQLSSVVARLFYEVVTSEGKPNNS